jgi:hypothetical protein
MVKGERMKTVELEELIPWTDERPLTEELLLELDFERCESHDEVDNSDYTYYVWNHQNDNLPNLYADVDDEGHAWQVRLTHYDHITESPYWNTYGTVKMLMICLQGDANG